MNGLDWDSLTMTISRNGRGGRDSSWRSRMISSFTISAAGPLRAMALMPKSC